MIYRDLSSLREVYNEAMAHNMLMTPPPDLPEPGFYYHYKHDPAGPLENYAYEVIGTGCGTEEDWSSPNAYSVIYRPLYESSPAYKAGWLWFLRPAVMFTEDVVKPDGMKTPRFHRIVNPEIISELDAKRKELYHTI
jgi:hypothetical protein